MSFRFKTQEAGAFLELYRPIGNDPYTRDLSTPRMPENKRDWMMALFRCELCRRTDCPNERVSLGEIKRIASGVVVDIDGKRYCFERR